MNILNFSKSSPEIKVDLQFLFKNLLNFVFLHGLEDPANAVESTESFYFLVIFLKTEKTQI